jgi:hypothetical protein
MESPLLATCYCGAVEWQVSSTATVRSLICHCESCRRAHASPLYHACFVAPEAFQVTKGADLVRSFGKTRPEVLQRHFCSVCGTRTHNSLKRAEGDLVGVFPSTFHEAKHPLFTATYHVHCAEAVLDLDALFDDGLPHYPEWSKPAQPAAK